MPPVNHVAVSAGVIALSVAVAAAIAVYESPELRRMADDLRRRVAIALHSLGDGINPNDLRDRATGEPIFNRPEDADGFLQSRGLAGAQQSADVDADEETRRRQREELMYWNRVLEEKREKEEQAARQREPENPQLTRPRGTSFDDFLLEDRSERGAYVFNTGADVWAGEEGLVRRRGQQPEGVRGLNASVYANPFGDEHGIDLDEHPAMEANILSPGRDELLSDIYNATEPDATHNHNPEVPTANLSAPPEALPQVLFDATAAKDEAMSLDSRTADHEELGQDEYMTAGQADYSQEAYASIQAWAQNTSHTGFYSPLPVSPAAPLSEPELISEGALTPTDSASTVGSGVDVANDVVSVTEGREAHDFDVLSDDGVSGIATPTGSWSEVGSVVSESDAGAQPMRA